MELDVPELTALAMTVGGLLLAVSCVLSRVGARFGLPVSLMFLAVGVLAGCDGIGGIEFDEFPLAYTAGTIALSAVLFAGGLQTNVRHLRGAVAPASVLATVGVLGVASITALGGYWLGLPWHEAWLIGAIVASTDASAVFSVLQGVTLPRRVAHTIELESGLNDPMAVILTLAMTAHLLGEPISATSLALEVLHQLAVGAAFGVALGYATRMLLLRAPLSTPALTPVLTLGSALIAFGAPTLFGGSGFLAAYFAGMVVGNAPLRHRTQLLRVHDSLSWLSQVSMFLMQGLLVTPSHLPRAAWIGLPLALILALVARPLTVYLCLLPFRFDWRQKAFIAWVGLRGAVPIVLATVPVLRSEGQPAHMVEALDVFDLVFFVVVVSSFLPGATVQLTARWLGLEGGESRASESANPPAPMLASVERPTLAG